MRTLLTHDLVDVWKVTADHADIRLHRNLYEQVRDKFPECSVLHPCVESLVKEFEQSMVKGKANVTADWFDNYVSLL